MQTLEEQKRLREFLKLMLREMHWAKQIKIENPRAVTRQIKKAAALIANYY